MEISALRSNLQQPFQTGVCLDVLYNVFGNSLLIEQRPEHIPILKGAAKSIERIAALSLTEGRNLAVLQIKTSQEVKIERNRIALRDIAFRLIDQDRYHGLLVFYYSESTAQQDYRMSFISKNTEFDDAGNLVTTETHPKRYSYVLGPGESCTTAAQRFLELKGILTKRKETQASLKDLVDAFNVGKLNDEFFKQYRDKHYRNFWTFIANVPEYREVLLDKEEADAVKAEKPIRDFVKKMLGRIVFLHFLQKKGWMGCPATATEWVDGDKAFMQNLFANFADKEGFYSNCLTDLFFNTLNNSARDNSIFHHTRTRVPYLNGGLYDDDQPQTNSFNFPAVYFKDLLEFFEQYNFTIDENSPDEQEVGIDPEMLGHIFENLLEENREKGTYYTPKEIVHYMCKESLVRYLCSKMPECADCNGAEGSAIADFINDGLQNRTDAKHFVVKNAKRIETLLDAIKVCDPAIGSGAFPMGMLQEIFKAKLGLDLTLDRAKAKKDIIQNSIYGVDLEKGAVDIARLRFWLSLVVDEEEPQPLPNLDFKIMQGNSLLESFEDVNLSRIAIDEEDDIILTSANGQMELGVEFSKRKQPSIVFEKHTRNELQTLIRDYFDFDTILRPQYTSKQEIKSRINAIVDGYLRATFYKESEHCKGEIHRFSTLYVANTPYEADAPAKKRQKEAIRIKLQKEIERLNARLVHLGEILERITAWEDEGKDRPYFLWHTYFKDVLDAGGFDVVIGNPPYLRIQGIRESDSAFADVLVKQYKSATGSFDLYVTFLEKGLALIREDGIVNYIMPVKWTNAAFGSGLRRLVAETHSAYKIINFGAHQVFNASTYTGLQWFKRNSESLTYFELNQNLPSKEELGTYLKSLNGTVGAQIPVNKLSTESWVLTVGKTTEILAKLNQQPRRLSDVFEKIFQGLATSKDDVYFLYDCKVESDCIIGFSKQLQEFVRIEQAFTKPLLKGEDVHRYQPVTTNRVVVFPYKLTGDNAELFTEQEIIDDFPLAYVYLKRCEDVLRDREKGRLKHDSSWYRYIYPKNLNLFKNQKLVAPEISQGGNFSLDENGGFYATTKIYGYVKNATIGESYKFWLGLLNSSLFWFFIQQTGYVLRGGYFTFKTNYILPFPVPKKIPSTLADSVEKLVDKILDAKKKSSESDITYCESEINRLIYQLYSLSETEIQTIEA